MFFLNFGCSLFSHEYMMLFSGVFSRLESMYLIGMISSLEHLSVIAIVLLVLSSSTCRCSVFLCNSLQICPSSPVHQFLSVCSAH